MKMGVIHTLAGEGYKIMKNSMQVVDQENGTERLMMYKEIQQ
jgi:DNA-binding winged helix-turn-helix (wHTH) protein